MKIIGETNWMSLYETDNGYTVAHEKRCLGHIVAVLPYKKTVGDFDSFTNEQQESLIPYGEGDGNILYEFLLRQEVNPAWGPDDTSHLCCLTGGCEQDKQPVTTAVNELREEAGYEVGEVEMIPCRVIRGSKGMDTFYHLYFVNLTDKKPTKALEYDGPYEAMSKSVWTHNLIPCVDPMVFSIFYHWAKRIL